MNTDKLGQLRIEPNQKRRPGGSLWLIVGGVAIVTSMSAAISRLKPFTLFFILTPFCLMNFFQFNNSWVF